MFTPFQQDLINSLKENRPFDSKSSDHVLWEDIRDSLLDVLHKNFPETNTKKFVKAYEAATLDRDEEYAARCVEENKLGAMTLI